MRFTKNKEGFYFFFLILFSCASVPQTALVGEQAPFARFAMLDGRFETTENYRGRFLLLHFWASGCSRSKSVLEDVNQWIEENRGKNPVSVISVNIDKYDKESKVRELIHGLKLRYIENSFSGNDIYDEAYMAYDVGELPTLVLIDPKGKIVGRGTSTVVLEDAFS